ncbi:MAG: fibronectin type III domain-containing protein [Bacteroidales bacterium]|nr:fibronectin type III domain-containing protein [Bacteroidales bacterium]
MVKRLSLLLAALFMFVGGFSQVTVNVGEVNADSYNTYTPMYTYYDYSYSQSVYTPDEFEVTGTINTIAYYMQTVTSSREFTVRIYMAEVDRTTLTTSDYVTEGFVKVYDGLINTGTAGWITLTLDEPFEYSGDKSLVIAFENANGSYFNAPRWLTKAAENTSVVWWRDSTPETLDNLGGQSTNVGSKPILQLGVTPPEGFVASASNLAASATANSAILTWDEAYGATSYVVYYKLLTDEEYTSVETTDNKVTLTDLNETSLYSFYVVSNGTAAASKEVQFKTACQPTAVPFAYGFDNLVYADAVAVIPCWEFVASGNYPQISDDYAVSMENSLKIANNSYVALPFMDKSVKDLQLSFKMYATGANYGVTVGTMTDNAASSSFVEYSTVNVSAANQWEEFTVNMRNYDGNANYIAIKGNSNYVYIDDIQITERGACEPPADNSLAVTSLDATSATIVWEDAIEDHAAWKVYYKASDADEYTSVSANEKSATLNNLSAQTSYNVYVTTVCGEGEESGKSTSFTFTTPCLALTAEDLPWETTFTEFAVNAENNPLPVCWTASDPNSVWTYQYGPIGYDDNACVEFKGGSNVLAMQGIDADLLKGLQLTFYHRANSSSYGTMEVGYMTDPNNTETFVSLTTLAAVYKNSGHNNAAYYSDEPAVVFFNNVEATGVVYPAFRYTSANANCSWYLDVFRLGEAPTCLPVSGNVTISDITVDAATVTFTDDVEEHTAWKVYYQEDDSDIAVIETEEKSVELTGLNHSTKYNVWVTAVCDGNDESEEGSAKTSFSTPCLYAELPINENFDSYSSISDMGCWAVINNGSMSVADHRLNFSSNSSFSNEVAIFPAFDVEANPITGLQLTGKIAVNGYFTSYYTYNVYVGVMSDPTDAGTFVQLATIAPNAAYLSWRDFEINFSDYAEQITNEHKYVAFKGANGAYWNIVVDDVYLGPAPTCFATISDFAATEVTQTSAKVSFEDAIEENTNWNVYYKSSEESEYNVIATTEKSVELNDLAASSVYSVYVTSNCGNAESKPSSTFTFSTLCGSLTMENIPWTDNFDNGTGGNAPNCWIETKPFYSTHNNENHNYPAIIGGQSNWIVYSTPAALEITGNNSDPDGQIISTPVFEDMDWAALQVSFMYRKLNTAATHGYLELGYLTDPSDASTYVAIQQFEPATTGSSQAAWNEAVAYLTSVPAEAKSLAIKSTISNRYNSWYVDDFKIDYAPTCIPAMTNITATDVTKTSVKLSFEDALEAHDSWNVYYQAQGSEDIKSVPTTAKTGINLIGLTPATTYSVWITAQCSADDESEASAAVSFTTECDAISEFPYYEGFNVAALPQCWKVVAASGTNNPHVQGGLSGGNNVAYDGNMALEIKGGNLVYALPEISDLQQMRLEFYYRQNGTTTQHIGGGAEGSAGTMEVGYLTDVTDAETFVSIKTLDEYAGEATGVMRRARIVLADVPQTATNIALRYTMANNQVSWYIDGVTVDYNPACDIELSDISASDATKEGFTVTWKKDADAVKYAVRYRAVGTEDWTSVDAEGTPVVNTNEEGEEETTDLLSAVLTGLNHSTMYEYAVAAYCSSNDLSKYFDGASNIATLCAPTDLPWGENFNADVLCMDKTANVSYNSEAARFQTRANDNLYTPEFNLEANKVYAVTYNYRTQGSATWFDIKTNLVSGEDRQTVQEIGALANVSNVSENVLNTYMFSVETSGVYGLGIYARSNGVSSSYLFIDDIYVSEVNAEEGVICDNQVYTLGDKQLNEAGVYYDTVVNEDGFATLTELTLTVNETYAPVIDAEICEGETYELNNFNESEAGTYTQELQSINGCDSVVTLNLVVNPVYNETIEAVIPLGTSYTDNGFNVSEAGEHTLNLQSVKGCDSTVVLNLTIMEAFETQLEATICDNEVYTFGNQELTTAGTYKDTVPSSVITADGSAIDSVLILTLNVNPTFVTERSAEICFGEVYNEEPFANISPEEAGLFTFYDTLQAITGCDSIIALNLNVKPSYNIVIDTAICEGESFDEGGIVANTTGVYTQKLKTDDGCDSLITLNLVVNPVKETNFEATICSGVTYNENNFNVTPKLDGKELEEGETSKDSVFVQNLKTYLGCDSTVTLTLHVLPSYEDTIIAEICKGETYSEFGFNANRSGEYRQHNEAANGCSSDLVLMLTVNDVYNVDAEQYICKGETFTFGDADYTDEGTYTYTFQSISGCDSTVNLTLKYYPYDTVLVEEYVCPGTSFTYNGVAYSTPDVDNYVVVGQRIEGCDSVVNFVLRNYEQYTEPVTVDEYAICYGQTYEWNGITYTADEYTVGENYYETTLQSINGCDSVAGLTLTVNPVYNDETVVATINAGETYTFAKLQGRDDEGKTYQYAGVYTETLTSINGCDSVVTLQLNVRNTLTVDLCPGEQTFDLNGTELSEAGSYSATIPVNGADSAVTVTINVLEDYRNVVENVTICEDEPYVAADGFTTSTAGTYTLKLTSENGCDSTVTLTVAVNRVERASTEVAICEGEEYVWTDGDGETYTETGVYEYTGETADGCHYFKTLNLTVNPVYAITVDTTICEGSEYVGPNFVTANKPGTYTLNLQTINGCDSVITLNLKTTDVLTAEETITVCPSALPYTYNGVEMAAAGEYTTTLTAVGGCDSVVTVTLNVNEVLEETVEATICDGSMYEFNGISYGTEGEYSVTLQSVLTGCDSVATLKLTVTPMETEEITADICEGNSYEFFGEELTQAGEYTNDQTNDNGCVIKRTVLTLNVITNEPENITEFICEGESYDFYGQQLTTAGNYNKFIETDNGCQKAINLTLNVGTAEVNEISAAICEGGSYNFFGEELTQAGEYTHEETSEATGCVTSKTILNLEVNDVLATTIDSTICNGEFVQFGNNVIYTTGTFTQTLQSVNGCDSIVTLNLTVNDKKSTTKNVTLCEGEEYEFAGQVLTESGVYTEELQSVGGCDSIVTLNLTVNPVKNVELTQTICEGEVYTFNGHIYNTAGTYVADLQTANGCDSTVTLTLVVNSKEATSLEATICKGEAYDFGGQTLTTAGTYTRTLKTYLGCDSVVTLTLKVNNTTQNNITATTCEGTPYEFNGQELTSTGVYTANLKTVDGCDSVVTLALTVTPNIHTYQTATICEGASYQFNGEALTEAGTYEAVLVSANNCDSIVTLTLYVNDAVETELTETICQGSSYTFNGKIYTTAGTYTANLKTVNGCDSTVTLTLNVEDALTENVEATICAGSSYQFYGKTLTKAGTYTETYKNNNGCDVNVTLTLTVEDTLTENVEATICAGSSYQFYGKTLTNAGTYTETYKNNNGCDVKVTLTLNVEDALTENVEATICAGSSYQFYGRTLTEAGTYNASYKNNNGCDVNVVLTLNVTDALTAEIEETICEGTSYSFNGRTLTEAGTYTETVKTANGCDSIVTLTLNVNEKLTEDIEATICEGTSYQFNGQTYTTAGTYTATFKSVNGCDSVVTLTLNVNEKLSDTIDINTCEGEEIELNGEKVIATLSMSGTRTYTTQSVVTGCDSITVVNITVNPIEKSIETAVLTYMGTYEFGGKTYDTPGTYYDTLQTINGCDSIVTLVLQASGIEDVENNVSVSVYPVPTFGDATLSLTGVTTEAEVIVSDELGRVVYSAKVAQGVESVTIPSSSFAKGYYSVTVKANNLYKTKKLLRQ